MIGDVWALFHSKVILRPEGFYFLRVNDRLVIAQLVGWNERPVFRIVGDDSEESVNTSVEVVGETRDPFRERDRTDPPVA